MFVRWLLGSVFSPLFLTSFLLCSTHIQLYDVGDANFISAVYLNLCYSLAFDFEQSFRSRNRSVTVCCCRPTVGRGLSFQRWIRLRQHHTSLKIIWGNYDQFCFNLNAVLDIESGFLCCRPSSQIKRCKGSVPVYSWESQLILLSSSKYIHISICICTYYMYVVISSFTQPSYFLSSM